MGMPLRDITGQRFGKLTAVRYERINEKGKTGWWCICDCGKEVKVGSSNLFYKNTQSCGCIRMPQPVEVGRKFGRLIVNSFYGRTKNNIKKWLCKCECGKVKVVMQNNLLGKRTLSCGCFHRDQCRRYGSTGYKELSGKLWCRIKNNAKSRGIDILINIEDAYNLFIDQKSKCIISGVALFLDYKTGNTSLDRKDSKLPYSLNNIQWVHKEINRMKMNLSDIRLIEWCNIIHKNNKIKMQIK